MFGEGGSGEVIGCLRVGGVMGGLLKGTDHWQGGKDLLELGLGEK